MRKPKPMALLLLLAGAAYLPCLTGDFVYDDYRFIEHNPYMDGPFDAASVFSDPGTMERLPVHDIYRPLRTLLFYAERQLGRKGTFLHHLVGVLIHLLNTWLVYQLILLILAEQRYALLGAGLFALHPVQVESVAWISSRADQLVAFFVLLALIHMLRSKESRSPGRAVLTVSLTALACLSKESGMLTGGFAVLVWLCFSSFRTRAVAMHGLLSLGTAALYLFLRAKVLGPFEGQVPLHGGGEMTNFFTGLYGLGYQVSLLLTPWRMCVDYPDSFFDATPPRIWVVGALVLTFLVVLVSMLCKYRRKKILFGLLFMLLALLPTSSLIFPLRSLVNDRYLYLPLVGTAIMVSAWLRPSLLKPAALLLFVLFSLTFLRCMDWRSGERLWTATVASNPESIKARIGLSRIYFNGGQTDGALRMTLDALALCAPGSSMSTDARLLAAQSLNRLGKADAAAEQLRCALEEAEALGSGRTFRYRLITISEHLWSFEMRAGRFDEALHAAKRKMDLEGETPMGLLLQAQALRAMGRVSEAEAALWKAAALEGDCAEVHLELAELLKDTLRYEEARSEYEKGMRLRNQ